MIKYAKQVLDDFSEIITSTSSSPARLTTCLQFEMKEKRNYSPKNRPNNFIIPSLNYYSSV